MVYSVYKENKKRTPAGDGMYYYYYPYTPSAGDNTRLVYIDRTPCVRVEVPEDILNEMLEKDHEEYKNERNEHNPDYIADPPVVRKEEFGEVIENYWEENAVDPETINLQDDLCEQADKTDALDKLEEQEKQIYIMTEHGCTQEEIAEELGLDQSKISRHLENVCQYIDRVRLDDGTRSKQDLDFEVARESFLRNKRMPHNEDCILFMFWFLSEPQMRMTYMKWFYSNREFARYGLRYIFAHKEKSKENINDYIARFSEEGREYYNKHYSNKQSELQWLFVQIMLEIERRARILPEPKCTSYAELQEDMKALAKRRKLPYERYKEIIMQKLEYRRLGYLIRYSKRYAARTRNEKAKAILRAEIEDMTRQRKVILERIEKLRQIVV